MIKVIFICLLVCAAYAEDQIAAPTENQLMESVYQKCLEDDPLSCVKYEVYTKVDEVLNKDAAITVTEGVQIVPSPESSGAPRSLSSDDTIDSAMFKKVQNFIESRTVKFDLSGNEIITTASRAARSIGETIDNMLSSNEGEVDEEGRGKKKKIKKILGPIFGIIALKAGFLMKLLIMGVALLAGKALLVSKVALVLALIIGIKKLLSSKGGHTEIIATPIHTVSHVGHDAHHLGGGGYGGDIGAGYGAEAGGHGHGGWARNAEAQNLAYKAYKAQETQS